MTATRRTVREQRYVDSFKNVFEGDEYSIWRSGYLASEADKMFYVFSPGLIREDILSHKFPYRLCAQTYKKLLAKWPDSRNWRQPTNITAIVAIEE